MLLALIVAGSGGANAAGASAVLASSQPQAAQSASGPPSKAACVDAYRANQPLRRDGAYRAAIQHLLVCARDPCPAVLQTDCIVWLREAQALVPSILVKARRGTQADLADVRVTMDGVELAARLDGRAINVDVGEHELVFEHRGAPSVTKRLLIIEGEKARVVEVEFPVDPATPAASALLRPTGPIDTTISSRPIPWPVYALGGLAVVSLATSAGFGVAGIMRRGDLGECRPHCAPEEVDAAARLFRISDIALAASAVSLVGASVFFLARPTVQVTASPTPNGVGLSVGSVF